MAEHQVLFCPFCHESFEGQRTCPEHELALVPFDKLPIDPLEARSEELLDLETPVATFDLRFGRGLVGAGALLTALALGLDMVRLPTRGALSGFLLATAVPSLWTLGLLAFTLLFLLRRRRTLRAMQGLRVLVPALALLSPATVFWALHRVRSGGAFLLTHNDGSQAEAGTGVYIACAAALLIAAGGVRLGLAKRAAKR